MDLVQAERSRTDPRRGGESGYAMAALLVGLSIMAVLMSMALPVWSQMVKREKETELIWRGQQYARAIALFQRKFANTFPPNIDVLVEQRFLRKKYKDPITNDDFQPIPVGGAATAPVQPGDGRGPARQSSPPPQTGIPSRPQTAGPVGTPASGPGPSIGIQGVVSKSKDTSIRIYNGRSKYNEWVFVHVATAQRPGGPQLGTGQGQGPRPGGGPFQPGVGPFAPGGPNRPPVPGEPPFPQPSVTPFGPPRQPGSPPQRPPPQPPPGR